MGKTYIRHRESLRVGGKSTFECHLCLEVFDRKDLFREHYEREHREEKVLEKHSR